MYHSHDDLFEPAFALDDGEKFIEPWKPVALDHEQWPPSYERVYAWRIRTLSLLRKDSKLLQDAIAFYRTHPAEFIMHWMDTYNPRKQEGKWMPFVLFSRQLEFVWFLEELRIDGENGLVEKCRDIGATWLACAYSVWCMLFIDQDSTGWGSRKQDLVDKLGDPDSIFEKIRLLLDRLPSEFKPKEIKEAHMKLINSDNGASITGESGDNIGRGGRKSRYFKDEAQPLHAPVLTPLGWVKMGDLHVGGAVIGPDGSWRRITHINDCGVHPTYRVTLVDGSTIECSENHLWTVQNVRSKKWLTLSLAQIKNDYVNRFNQYKYRLPEIKPVEFAYNGELPLDPYIVGVLIGDGSIKHVPYYRPSFTSIDQHIVDRVQILLPQTCRVVSADDGLNHRIGDVDGRRGQGKISRASQAIVEAGIAGHGAETKFVPNRYKFSTVENRVSLLQGLMDTDGSASGGTNTYHTCSRQLAEDVRFLVQSLGGRASLNVKPDHRGYRDMYCLHIVFENDIQPFSLPRKLDAYKPRRKSWGRNITNIEYIGMQPVRCITVDADDGLYIGENCILTHNSAHYERPEKIEAALGDNTDVQVDISSVNGIGNIFHRRREGGEIWEPNKKIEPGKVRVFIFDWRDHPEKNQAWYDARKARAEREGMQHIFAQEVDRSYDAAVMNTIISYEWIEAAVDAHFKIPCLRVPPPDEWMAGQDVADEGNDKNALAVRQWVILRHLQEWGERDPGVTTRRMLSELKVLGRKHLKVQYDCIGIGSAVKAEYNRLIDEGEVNPSEYMLVPWNAGGKVVDPYDRVIKGDDQSAYNFDFFGNFKAQAWWSLRTRFYKTWRAVTQDAVYRPDELISIDSANIPTALLQQLKKELAQPTRGSTSNLKMIVNKTPEGTRSPNLADAVVQCYFPARDPGNEIFVGKLNG